MTPHRKMAQLDGRGESYWLEDIILPNGKSYPTADVLSHSEDWLELRMGCAAPLWVPAKQCSFRLVEG